MVQAEIYDKLTVLFRDVFEDDSLCLSPEMTATDIDGWDSLSNIRLVLAVETTFRIRLSAAQVASLSKLGDLVALIEMKTRQSAA